MGSVEAGEAYLLLGKVRDGDVIRLDSQAGTLDALVDAAEWAVMKTHAALGADALQRLLQAVQAHRTPGAGDVGDEVDGDGVGVGVGVGVRVRVRDPRA